MNRVQRALLSGNYVRLGSTSLRPEAVRSVLNRLIDGKPGFMLSPACTKLRKALAGRYCYRRVQVGNDERFEDKPSKNTYSHIADALQYGLLGSGRGRELLGKKKRERHGPPPQPARGFGFGPGSRRTARVS